MTLQLTTVLLQKHKDHVIARGLSILNGCTETFNVRNLISAYGWHMQSGKIWSVSRIAMQPWLTRLVDMENVRSVNSMAASDSVEIAQWLILFWSWGGQCILFGRTGFPKKMCPHTHFPGGQIFLRHVAICICY